MASTIKLKRTTRNVDTILNQSLEYGEPLVVVENTGTADSPNYQTAYLVIGSNKSGPNLKTINQERRIAFANKEIAQDSVYYKDGLLVDNNGQRIQLQSTNLYLRFLKDGQVQETYNGATTVDVTTETIGALSSTNSVVTTPSGSNPNSIVNVQYVNDQFASFSPTYRGYYIRQVPSIDPSGLVCDKWNTEYRLPTFGGDLKITLPEVISTCAAEVRICVVISGNTNLVVYPNDPNTTVITGWSDLAPLSGVKYYEISFAILGVYNSKTYISCLANEISLA